jgi:hypothetical protein
VKFDFFETCNAFYTNANQHSWNNMNHSILNCHSNVKDYLKYVDKIASEASGASGEIPSFRTINEIVNKECNVLITQLEKLAERSSHLFPQEEDLDAKGTLEKVSLFCNAMPLCKEKKDLEGKMATFQELRRLIGSKSSTDTYQMTLLWISLTRFTRWQMELMFHWNGRRWKRWNEME